MKEDKHCNRGIFKTPLQSLSSYLLRKTREKIFPCSLLLRECLLLLYLYELL